MKNVATKLRLQFQSLTENREKSKAYVGHEAQKNEKSHNHVTEQPRVMKQRCKHTSIISKSNRSFLCAAFTDEDRKNAFEQFWNNYSGWNSKKSYVRGLVSTRKITRRRTSISKNVSKLKKNIEYDFFLKKIDGTKMQVCRNFFLSTLNLGEDTFKRWLKPAEDNCDEIISSAEELGGNVGPWNDIGKPVKKRRRVKGSSPTFRSLDE